MSFRFTYIFEELSVETAVNSWEGVNLSILVLSTSSQIPPDFDITP